MNHRLNAEILRLPWCAECRALGGQPCRTTQGYVTAPHRVREAAAAGTVLAIPVEVARRRRLLKLLRAAIASLALVACGTPGEPATDAAIIHVMTDDAAPDARPDAACVPPDAPGDCCSLMPDAGAAAACLRDELPEGRCAELVCGACGVVGACHPFADAGVDAS